MFLNTIIVDDELSGREMLAELLGKYCPDVKVVDKCEDVESAVRSIGKYNPHLVFLDVEMPNYAGYELVDFLEEVNFQIIFVTAYDKYAMKAFEIAAIDYLLKPIEIDKLKLAVAKAKNAMMVSDYKEQLEMLAQELRSSEHKITYLEKGYTHYVLVEDIVALEANRAYSKIYLKNADSIIVSKNLSQLEEELSPYSNFVRIHRSWLVNTKSIHSYSKSKLEIKLENNITARLSKQFKSNFESLVGL